MKRTATLSSLALLLLPIAAAPSIATPMVDTRVPPAEVVNEIGRIVRREFYDRDGLAAFNAAEQGLNSAAPGESVLDASGDWLAALNASHTGRFTRIRSTILSSPMSSHAAFATR